MYYTGFEYGLHKDMFLLQKNIQKVQLHYFMLHRIHLLRDKVIYPKYSKHYPYFLAATIHVAVVKYKITVKIISFTFRGFFCGLKLRIKLQIQDYILSCNIV